MLRFFTGSAAPRSRASGSAGSSSVTRMERSGSSVPPSSEFICEGKFVELTYKVTDRKTGHVVTRVEFPLGYVHGHNEILAPSVHMQLKGKSAGDTIEVVIDGNQIFGPRDESL